MPRRIIRIDNESTSVAIERAFESEAQLHQAVTSHPEVLPSEDLNIGQLVTVATELDLGSGPMDLLAADPQGRLVIIEFKRGTENPDVRRVVAQMLDYGSSLWRKPYKELEQAVSRRLPQGLSSLAEMVGERFVHLEVPFDSDAFQNGVSGCLERGNFVFMYVARDLDKKTKRLMTYLADGAQMTFFAVEMDYFTDTTGNSVLVPRTAFIPSWVASGEPANARRSSEEPYDITAASSEVRSFASHMDEVARELGLRIRSAPTGPHYHPAIREAGVSFSLGVGVNVTKQTADFNILAFRQRGRGSTADEFISRIRKLTGMSKVPPSWPAVPVAPLVRDWPRTKRELIDPYFRERAAQVSPNTIASP